MRLTPIAPFLVPAAFVLAAALSACEDADELAVLEARLAAEEATLAEKQTIAQNLNSYRRELVQLQKRIAEANVPLVWDNAEVMARIEKASSGSMKSFAPGEKGAHVVLGADNGADGMALALAGLQVQIPTALIRGAELHGKTWKIELDLEKPDALVATATAAPARAPLPPRTWRSGERSEQLRAYIARTQAKTAELERVLGEVAQLTRTRRLCDRLLLELEDPGRAKRAVPVIAAVFTDRPALVTDGAAIFVDGVFRVRIAEGKKPVELVPALKGKAKVVAFSDGPPATVELSPIPR